MTIFNVTTAADSGVGSLRNAIASAKNGDTIKFAPILANKVIKLTSGQINIQNNLTIDGAGAANLKISGNSSTRVFQVGRHVDATVRNLTIADGQTTEKGGGIQVVDYGSIKVENCRFTNNRGGVAGAIYIGFGGKGTVNNSSFDYNDGTLAKSGHSGGAIATYGSGVLNVKDCQFTNNKGVNGGAIYTLLSGLTVENSVFRNNSSVGEGGGGIFCDGANPIGPGSTVGALITIRGSRFEGNQTKGEGGALFLYGYGQDKILLENSIVVGNKANLSDKGIARGGALRGNGALTIRNVTFANNTAEKQGGALWLDGGNEKNIINSTFSGNTVIKDTGGAMFINTDKSAPVNIINSTIVNNSAGRACGAVWIGSPTAPVKLTNSIVANNTSGSPREAQVGYQLQDGGGNIEFSASSRAGRVVAGSRIVDPLLGALQTIGGDLVHPLLAGSPAINSGRTGSGIPTIDARGMERDGKPDVGAFEISSVQISGAAANTSMSGPNLIRGSRNNDSITGTSNNNIIMGGDGNDTLRGGNSVDMMNGGEGDDVLIGGQGADFLCGVGGKDRFVYERVSDKGDQIKYFEGSKDVIDLRKIIDGANFVSSNPFQAYIKKQQVGSNTVVSINSNGNLTPNQFQPFLTIQNFASSNLTEKNFLL
ncbi:hypothetical protein NIES2100_66880 [Calothrix sp. NIES-2100]|uniref:choice-of-anchor Q domain-containing protein n=1 Tax=Calothrix sp. NIES-2100 TaxID=1954172 RepID=UPI000B613DAE|nr:hypothetical protein NIES2100_66880 [Calothrix sp. NIES-2100]